MLKYSDAKEKHAPSRKTIYIIKIVLPEIHALNFQLSATEFVFELEYTGIQLQ